MRHTGRCRRRVIRLPWLTLSCPGNKANKPHQPIATMSVALYNPIPKGAVNTRASLAVLAVFFLRASLSGYAPASARTIERRSPSAASPAPSPPRRRIDAPHPIVVHAHKVRAQLFERRVRTPKVIARPDRPSRHTQICAHVTRQPVAVAS